MAITIFFSNPNEIRLHRNAIFIRYLINSLPCLILTWYPDQYQVRFSLNDNFDLGIGQGHGNQSCANIENKLLPTCTISSIMDIYSLNLLVAIEGSPGHKNMPVVI